MLIHRALSKLKRLCLPTPPPPPRLPWRPPEFSIGIYIGRSPLQLGPPESLVNPVLTRKHVSDVPAGFVADPFMLKVQQTWYMFFEVFNKQTAKGEIGLATSDDGMQWVYQQIVLAEPFHLSYPYVFEWNDEYYMIPESYMASSVRLYRASRFPTKWSFVRTLLNSSLTKHHFTDGSIFYHEGKWWLFTETNPADSFDTLRLYYAQDLLGPWSEHKKSPIIRRNPRLARPAGRVIQFEDKFIRYTQDCYPQYGSRVRACEITLLTKDNYREIERGESPVLFGGAYEWNACGMHHIDSHLTENGIWLASVDGWRRVNPEE